MATIMQRTHVTKRLLNASQTLVANSNQSSTNAVPIVPEDGSYTGPEMVTASPGPVSKAKQAVM